MDAIGSYRGKMAMMPHKCVLRTATEDDLGVDLGDDWSWTPSTRPTLRVARPWRSRRIHTRMISIARSDSSELSRSQLPSVPDCECTSAYQFMLPPTARSGRTPETNAPKTDRARSPVPRRATRVVEPADPSYGRLIPVASGLPWPTVANTRNALTSGGLRRQPRSGVMARSP